MPETQNTNNLIERKQYMQIKQDNRIKIAVFPA